VPQPIFQQRFKPRMTSFPKDIRWTFFDRTMNCLKFRPREKAELEKIQAEFSPDLVIIDTLRKAYVGDEKAGDIPSRVYGAFREIFSTPAILYFHHDRKSAREGSLAPAAEDFSGHQAWLNDANVGLHLLICKDHNRRLDLTKSHFSDSENFPNLTL